MKMQQMKMQKKNTDVKNDGTAKDDTSKSCSKTVHQVMAVRRLMVHSQVRINVQLLRTSKTRLHIPPVILKTSLCVIFSDCTYSHHSLYQKAKKYFVGSKTCKKGEKKAVTAGQQ